MDDNNLNNKYVVTLDNFDGPLDLLLHLIKEQDIDIYDIKIEEITKQYLDFINTTNVKELAELLKIQSNKESIMLDSLYEKYKNQKRKTLL